jgi:hypothetical protein
LKIFFEGKISWSTVQFPSTNEINKSAPSTIKHTERNVPGIELAIFTA